MNILLTSTARRIDLVGFFKEALKKADIDGKVIVADPEYNAPSLQAGDENYVIPEQTNTNYMEAIIEICKKHEVDCLVPLNDWEVPEISEHKRELEKLGVSVFAPNSSIVEKVRDKGKYRELLEPFKIKSPLSYFNVEDAKKALEKQEVSFPLIMKPRNGSASIGIEMIDNVEDMEFAYQHAVQEIKESPLAGDTSRKPEDNIIIQEVIEGDKFSVDMFNDMNLPPLKDEHLLKWGFLILKKKSSREHRLGDAPPDGGGCSLSHNKQHISMWAGTRHLLLIVLCNS